ncbi:MAG TPA: hypothetical protein VKG25_17375 [Bryobacteraceae bacterium]|nr:hypothetical protein [Bryobacteraceae bacterium]
MKISWKHQDTDLPNTLTFERKVELFYEQTFGWQLHIADLIANGGVPLSGGEAIKRVEHSGFAVLQICLSYFELIGSLYAANGESDTRKFKTGVQNVFPQLSDGSAASGQLLKRLHEGARCGLYHEGRIRPNIGLGQPPDGAVIAMDSSNGTVALSPERLPRALKAPFGGFPKSTVGPRE